MTPEQFEQAKREFAEKLIRFFWQNGNDDYHECKSQFDRIRDQNDCVSNYIDDFLSDLTALLEQHKEMLTPPSATAEEPYRCPVCGGNGLVPNGFYCQTSGDWPTTSISPEVCRSCNGTGVIFAAVLLHVIKTNEQ